MSSVYDKYSDQLGSKSNEKITDLLKKTLIYNLYEFKAADKNDSKNIIVEGEYLGLKDIFELVHKHKINHIIQKNRDDFLYNLTTAAIMIHQQDTFIKNPLPYFMNRDKNPFGNVTLREKEIKFNSTKNKMEIIKQVSIFLNEVEQTQKFKEAAGVIADELITNVIFNAPFLDGEYLNREKDRSEVIELSDGHHGVFKVAYDHSRLFISCEDDYGSLDYDSWSKRLYDVFVNDAKPLPPPHGGGYGYKLILENTSDLYVIVKSNIKTFVCCSFPLGEGLKKVLKIPRNLHLSFS